MRMLRDSSIVCRTSRHALPMINMVRTRLCFMLLPVGLLSLRLYRSQMIACLGNSPLAAGRGLGWLGAQVVYMAARIGR